MTNSNKSKLTVAEKELLHGLINNSEEAACTIFTNSKESSEKRSAVAKEYQKAIEELYGFIENL